MSIDDRRTAFAVAVVTFVAYAFFFGGSGFNQNASFDQARAIVERGTLRIDAYASNTADISRFGGAIYPNKAPGTSFLAAIPYALLHPLEKSAGLDVDRPPILTLNLYVATVVVCGLSGAGLAALMFLAARARSASRRDALAIAFLTAFATPLFAYSTMLFLHVPSAAFLLLGFHALFHPQRTRPLLGGMAAGAAGFTNYLCMPAAVVLGVALVVRDRARWRNAALYVCGGLPFAMLTAWYHRVCFGSITSLPVETENPAFLDHDRFLGILALPDPAALYGITLSPYRGLFFLSPFLALSFAGLWLMWKRMRTEAAVIAALAGGFVLFNASFNGWHGGYAIGPRYLLPIVPLLALTLVWLTPRLKVALAVLGSVSLLLNFVATAVDPQPPDSVRNPIFEYALPLLLHGEVPPENDVPSWLRDLYTGHVAVNRVAADEVLPFKHHPPGSPESEWASFNLGEVLTKQGHWSSLLPVLAWIAGGWFVIARRRGR